MPYKRSLLAAQSNQTKPITIISDISINNITQNSANPLDISLKLPIFMGISVINPNSYDLTVDTFDLTVFNLKFVYLSFESISPTKTFLFL